jgi:hypothetical protein|eukprot:COSAG01_NODE_1832_length_9109_cov_67.250721_16_plen_62_part_00
MRSVFVCALKKTSMALKTRWEGGEVAQNSMATCCHVRGTKFTALGMFIFRMYELLARSIYE